MGMTEVLSILRDHRKHISPFDGFSGLRDFVPQFFQRYQFLGQLGLLSFARFLNFRFHHPNCPIDGFHLKFF